jgi:O-methyltransferase
MPFAGPQKALKKILPKRWFAFIYRIATNIYVTGRKAADALYFFFAPVFYFVTGNTEGRKKLKTIKKVLPYTMVGRTGVLATYDVMKQADSRGIKGCIVECGVARGGSSALMALVAADDKANRKSWLFDSFEGLPEQTAEDGNPELVGKTPENRSAPVIAKGYCLGTIEEVENVFFNKLGFSRENVKLVKGWFQDTLIPNRQKVGDTAVLRLDGDWYESTRCCLESLYDNVVPGGYIIIDDYALAGCQKATDEFIRNRKLNVKLVHDKRGGCYFIKP